MARLAKSVAVALVIVAALTIYDAARVIASIRSTSSGGLGAVSFGASQALVELVVFTAVAWVGLYVKAKIRKAKIRPRQPPTRQ